MPQPANPTSTLQVPDREVPATSSRPRHRALPRRAERLRCPRPGGTRTSWLPNMQWPRPMTAHLMALANGSGGETFWIAANMNGRDHENAKVDKMLAPHWFEIAHARWPEARRLPRHVPGSRCQVPGRTATAFTTEGTEHTEKDEASSFQRTRLCRPLRSWRPLRFRSLPLSFIPHFALRISHSAVRKSSCKNATYVFRPPQYPLFGPKFSTKRPWR